MRGRNAAPGARTPPRPATEGRAVYQTGSARSLLLVAGLASCALGPSDAPWQRFERSERHMGVAVRIVAHAPDPARAEAAMAAAFARVADLDATLSDWDPRSELSRLGREGVGAPRRVSEDLWRVLALAGEVAAATDGAFDVTVGPAVVLWRRARRQAELPAAERLREALDRIGWRKVRMIARGQQVELAVPGMRLDLGGIAKGYAAQAALDVLRAHGVPCALVDAGGDLALGDAPPGETGWLVALGAMEPGAPPREAIRIANAAVATSGDLFRSVEIDGVRYAHIVDPRTGLGLTDRVQATAVAADGALADALASAACVLGPERAVAIAARFAGASVLVRRVRDGELETAVSPGFPPRIRAPAGR